MEPLENKDIQTAQKGRRKFLMRAGLGSLPVLLTLNSKAAWGTSTLNCSLSETASQMQSVQPEKFEQCASQFNSHGNAKSYFWEVSTFKANGNGKASYFYKAPNMPLESWKKEWDGHKIYQDTSFGSIFLGGYGGSLKQALHQGGGWEMSLIRNIAACFLHACYYQMEGISSNFPTPNEIVAAFINAISEQERRQLAALLEYYIDGYTT